MTPIPFPGTPAHQALLRGIVSHYVGDDRVLAIGVYGSLGRGDWDPYSDVDLDVVVADDVPLGHDWVADEVGAVLAACGWEPVVVFNGHEEADFVLPSLLRGSICFHSLARTRANIVDSLLVLSGILDQAAVVAAGRSNGPARVRPLATTLGMCMEYLVSVDARLHRRQFWLAYQSLYLARAELLQLFTACRPRWSRPYHVFEADADDTLKQRFGESLPQHSLASLQHAYLSLLRVIEEAIEEISSGQVRLTEAQCRLLSALRERQAGLDLGSV